MSISDVNLVELNRLKNNVGKKELCDGILSIRKYDNMLLNVSKPNINLLKKLKKKLGIKELNFEQKSNLKNKNIQFDNIITYRNVDSIEEFSRKYHEFTKDEDLFFSSNDDIVFYLFNRIQYEMLIYENVHYKKLFDYLDFLSNEMTPKELVIYYDLKGFYYFDIDIMKYEYYHLKGIEIAEQNNVLFPQIYFNTGHCYLHKLDFLKSEYYFDKAYEQNIQIGNFIYVMYLSYYKSVYYRRISKHELAIETLKKVLNNNENLKFKFLYYRVYNELGLNYYAMGHYQTAYHYFTLGMKSARPLDYYHITNETNLFANLLKSYYHIATEEEYIKKYHEIREYIKSLGNTTFSFSFELEMMENSQGRHDFIIHDALESIIDREDSKTAIYFLKSMIRKLIENKDYTHASIYQRKLNELT